MDRDRAAPEVDTVPGKGLLLGVECVSKEAGDAVLEAAFRRGLLTLAVGSGRYGSCRR